MARYLFDTDTCSYLMRGASPGLDVRVATVPVDDVSMSVITLAELHYAAIRADLRRRGAMIGANDLFIAVHARSLDLVLVTNHTAEFGRVPGLEVENWVGAAGS